MTEETFREKLKQAVTEAIAAGSNREEMIQELENAKRVVETVETAEEVW